MAIPGPGPILRLRNVSVRFSGVQALDHVSLDVPPDIVFGIIGPNGAGKTTLLNCISGVIRATRGSSIVYREHELTTIPVHRAAQLGIARTFQNISLLGDQSVRGNILMGLHLAIPYGPLGAFLPGRKVRSAEAAADQRVTEIVDLLRLPRALLDVRLDTLSLGQRKKIEIARAVVRRPNLLLLDEPAGGLNDRETSDLAASLRALRSDLNLSVILIDHDMNLVMDLCDRLCILNFGQKLAEGTPSEVQGNPDVISVYLGRSDAP